MHGTAATLRRAFPALVALQPVEWQRDGLLCAPRAAPDLAEDALRNCPLPASARPELAGLPSPAAEWVAGWYRRSPNHAPAPEGVRELVQADGEGFGPGGHPTTRLCLDAIRRLPRGPAVDVGCGSGLLAQAWARLHDEPVVALDIDPHAVAQTRRGIEDVGLERLVDVRVAPIASLTESELDERVLLANIPLQAHHELLTRLGSARVAGVTLSGLRHEEAPQVVRAYRARGLRPIAAARAGRWVRWVMVSA